MNNDLVVTNLTPLHEILSTDSALIKIISLVKWI